MRRWVFIKHARHLRSLRAKACGASWGRLCPTPPLMSPVRVLAREFLGVGSWLRVRRAIGIAFEGDRGHGDDRAFGEPLFQIVVFRLAFGQIRAASDNCGSRWRRDPGCRRTPRVRSNVASSKSHFGEASCQMSFANRAGICRSRPGRVRWRSNTGTTTGARPLAATASCRLPGCRSDSRSRRRAPCSAPAIAPR